MKLAEALNLRADIQRRIEQLSERLNLNAKVQEGEKPAEDPKKLIAELNALIEQLEKLIADINLTNAVTLLEGKTLTELIARKDALMMKNRIMRNFLSSASSVVDRYSNTEIKIKSTIDVETFQDKVDTLAVEIRELDVKIQMTNWTTDLIEKLYIG